MSTNKKTKNKRAKSAKRVKAEKKDYLSAYMIVLSLLAERKLYLKETVALIVVLDFIAWAAFVYGIGMIVPVWPSFLH